MVASKSLGGHSTDFQLLDTNYNTSPPGRKFVETLRKGKEVPAERSGVC